jgi:large conductance mechanosensitive channel
MLEEFREFINRGNVIDLAVAVVMGAAFSAIVNSLVNDIITPTAGIFTQWLNFSLLSLQIGAAQIPYGNFLQAVTKFLLIAWVVFLLVRMVNAMQKRLLHEQNTAPAKAPADVQLLTEIRDLLKGREKEYHV